MTINDFKEGDLVVIELVTGYLKRYSETKGFDYVGLICEVEKKGEYFGSVLNRKDTPPDEVVLNSGYSSTVTLRPATDREKFLYMMHGIKKLERSE